MRTTLFTRLPCEFVRSLRRASKISYKKCIKAQLEGYYKNEKVCKKEAKIKSMNKNGHPHAQAGGNQTNVT